MVLNIDQVNRHRNNFRCVYAQVSMYFLKAMTAQYQRAQLVSRSYFLNSISNKKIEGFWEVVDSRTTSGKIQGMSGTSYGDRKQ